MMMVRDVAPLSCAKAERIWNAATLKKPATMTCRRSPRGTRKLCPVRMAAANNVAAPMPTPAKRMLQGGTSRSAILAAIQWKPQAKASSTTSSLALAATSLLASLCDIVPFAPDPENAAQAIGSVLAWRGIPVMQNCGLQGRRGGGGGGAYAAPGC